MIGAGTFPSISAQIELVVFKLDEQRYALPLAVVDRIVRAVEVTPLPDAPRIVLGMIEVEDRILPVLNIRRRFGLAEREVGLDDQFLIARTARRGVALVVDEALGVIEYSQASVITPAQIVPGVESLQGVVKLDDGLVLIHDLEKFLSLNEGRALDKAMDQEISHGN
jgi:purine-binding chemotaxis protein CheW